jgi:hypothetical protein
MRVVSFEAVMAEVRAEFRARAQEAAAEPLGCGEVRRCPKCGQRCRIIGECRGRLMGTCRCSFTVGQWEAA